MIRKSSLDSVSDALNALRGGLSSIRPQVEKALEEAARFDRAFDKKRKKALERIHGGARRTQTDVV